jgi:hypothetical protein
LLRYSDIIFLIFGEKWGWWLTWVGGSLVNYVKKDLTRFSTGHLFLEPVGRLLPILEKTPLGKNYQSCYFVLVDVLQELVYSFCLPFKPLLPILGRSHVFLLVFSSSYIYLVPFLAIVKSSRPGLVLRGPLYGPPQVYLVLY